MRRYRFAILACATLLAAPAAWQDLRADMLAGLPETGSLTLRDNVLVDDDLVHLGDLFEEQISDGDIAVAKAPKPGETITLQARFLQQVARAYRLNWSPLSKDQQVTVGRVSQRVTAEMIHDSLARAVQDKTGSMNDLQVAIDGGDLTFDLPTDVSNSVAVSGINFNPISSRFAAILVAPAEGVPLIERTVYGTVYELAQVPVPNRLISAGEVVAEADLDWQPVQIGRLSNNSLTDMQQAVGHMAKRPLKAGQVMRSSDLVLAPAVKKNDMVQLVVQTGQMMLSTQGKVLQDAAVGQSVRVLNISTNRPLSGTVVDGSTVAIGFAVPTIN